MGQAGILEEHERIEPLAGELERVDKLVGSAHWVNQPSV
jgi:hypothetical protein